MAEKFYVWGLDLSQSLQGAGGIGGLIASVDNAGAVHHCLYDANGNVGQLVAEDGSIAARYEHDPFGNGIVAEGEMAEENPFRFSTKYFDAETGLCYYGFRYYSPELGRWTSRDPIAELGGLNLYVFVLNDPVSLNDPYGLDPIEDAVKWFSGRLGQPLKELSGELETATQGTVAFLGWNDPGLAGEIEREIKGQVDASGLNNLNDSLYTTAVVVFYAETFIWGAAMENAAAEGVFAIFRFCKSGKVINALNEIGRATRGFGGTRTGKSINPAEWIKSSKIVQRAKAKGISVRRTFFGSNEADIVGGVPEIRLSHFSSKTAAIEEYLHATTAQRALARGVSEASLLRRDVVLLEEIRIKRRLIGSSIKGLDRKSLRSTLRDYEIQLEVLRSLRPR